MLFKLFSLCGVTGEQTRLPSLFPLAATMFLLIVVFHLSNVIFFKPLLRDAHLGTALEYAHRPINLLKPVIVGFDANDSPVALEFPLWQAAVGCVFKITHSEWYGWGTLVSLLFFSSGLWPFFQLSKEYLGERIASWSVIFFLAQPLVIVWSGLASADSFCLVTTIWFLFFANKIICTNSARWWLPAVLFALLAAVSKPPFFMASGVCAFFLLLFNHVRSWKTWALLASIGVLATVTFLFWTRYTDSLLVQAEYPYADMQLLHGPKNAGWYLGDIDYRLNAGRWIKGGWRFLHSTAGALPASLLFLFAFFRRGNYFPKLWLLAALAAMLIFTKVVLEQWHYYLMFCPAIALLSGITLSRWETFIAKEIPSSTLRFSITALALVLSAVDGFIAMKMAIIYDPFPAQMAAIIREQTQPKDKLIIYCAGAQIWRGEELFASHRRGFFVASFQKNENGASFGVCSLLTGKDLERLKSLGYTKLVLMSESPAQFAAQAVNPGSHRQRFFYPPMISPSVDAWPVIYQSPDILIKEIP